MKRKIIKIDENLCNGCGDCVTGCAEGALKIINGKAKIVREDFCDGFGSCIGHCPTGALTIEEREAPEFNEEAVKEAQHHGCPGHQQRELRPASASTPSTTEGVTGAVNRSELAQWPVQLHLVNPKAPFLKNKELVVLSTCSPIASADVHWRYLRGRSVVVACPKLDDTSSYAQKLATICQEKTIPKVIVVIMEVPCCHGLAQIAKEAVILSGRKDLLLEIHIMSLEGELKGIKNIQL